VVLGNNGSHYSHAHTGMANLIVHRWCYRISAKGAQSLMNLIYIKRPLNNKPVISENSPKKNENKNPQKTLFFWDTTGRT
jgi:hypothetical protein